MDMKHEAIPGLIAAGCCLALITILFGFLLGVSFGAKEAAIKGHLKQAGAAALDAVYGGDVAAKDAVVSKSWSYLKRAHLHGGAIGAAALGAILSLILLRRRDRLAGWSALALGAGGLLYALFWLFAGLKAPGAGGTGAAKESLAFIALPGAGLCVLGLLGTIFCVAKSIFTGSGRS